MDSTGPVRLRDGERDRLPPAPPSDAHAMHPDPWRTAAAARIGLGVVATTPVGEGMTSRVERWHGADGRTVVAKRPRLPPAPGLYAAEASGLAALTDTPGLRVPRVLHHDHGGIVLEDLGPRAAEVPGDRDPYWERLGRAMAHLHGRLHGAFGWHEPTFWGVLRLDQRRDTDGVAFYRDQRFRWFLDRPEMAGRLPAAVRAGVDRIADRLDRLIPAQPPCLNHGDCWSGNRLTGPAGEPVLIDPAVHAGWAEADLSHAWIFGGFLPRFWDAYREAHPLDPGWPERLDILGLIHWLAIVREIGPDRESVDAIARVVARH
jgi:fructosamine-3-kinase